MTHSKQSSALLLVTLLAYAAWAVVAQATPPAVESDQVASCEIEATATFEDDETEFEPLEGVFGSTAGASGGQSGASQGVAQATVGVRPAVREGKVRLNVTMVRVKGGLGQFGQSDYKPDSVQLSWEARVSPPTWEFIWGGLAYTLTYNGKSSFHGEFLYPITSGQIGQEVHSLGMNTIFGQRTPLRFRPADIIRTGNQVTFRMHPRLPEMAGLITIRNIRRPDLKETLPYTVAPPEECTKVAE